MNSPKPIRFSRSDYHRLADAGIIQPSQHVELILGEIIEMSPKGIAHESCLRTLLRQLFLLVPETLVIGCQSPIAIGDSSEPEPDVSIAIGLESRYTGRHPNGNELVLAIEISESTLQYDSSTKARLYASAQIPNYWIFNLVEHCLETYSDPVEREGSWSYENLQRFLPSESLPIPLPETCEPKNLNLALVSL